MKPRAPATPAPRPPLGWLPAPLRAAVATTLLVINTLWWCGLLFVLAIVRLLLPWTAVRRVLDPWLNRVATAWIAGNSGWMRLTQRAAWDVDGIDDLGYRGWYLVVANHRSWVDVLTLIWAARSQSSRPTFNYEAMKNLNGEQQMRSDWLLPICGGAERLRYEDGKKAHPTQKPESLLYRVILASTRPGALVLDPFAGTGTTGAVAKRLGRSFVGIERDEQYAELAKRRISAVTTSLEQDVVDTTGRRQEPRIPFGWLVERGLLSPGTVLYDQRKRYAAKIRADGTLIAADHRGDHRGSIHRIGATLQGAPSCNGWTFWHFEAKGQLFPIDMLRQRLRSELH